MDLPALSLLCFAFCVGMEWTGTLQSGSPQGAGPNMKRNDGSISGRVVLHDYMLFLYHTLSRVQMRDFNVSGGAGFANTVTSFVDQGRDLSSRGQRYIFDLSSLARMEELVEAELRILRKPPADLLTALTSGGNLYNIRLYSCSSETQLLDSRSIEVLDGGLPRWEVFNVWSSMKAHLRNTSEPPQACFHLLAFSELTNEVAAPLVLGLGRTTRLPQEKALLVAFWHTDTTDDLFREIMDKMQSEGGGFRLLKPPKPILKQQKNRRHQQRAPSKRSLGGVGRGGKTGRRRNRCSRKSLHVNFKDLGWDDWVIAPLDYEAYRCDGICDFPLRAHLEPTNHAVIQTLLNSIDPDITPPSCCIPSRLSPISILYIDSGSNVVYKQYENMVVESCGCR
ncbi:growth/differentiation factor 6-A [Archocentrus centrarchus]|uniref:growth/differentiation factor 6-A n=1 Tax=Archocentrus centrarchus TaxID=63155 RepID=UPI0011E9EF04|nr:growth/differentiation factor 6-A-like [Archocentrus centrarchus]